MDVPKPPRGVHPGQAFPGMAQFQSAVDDEVLQHVKSSKELADLASSYVSRQVMLHTNLDLTACELDRLFKVIHSVSEENSKFLVRFIIDYHAKLEPTGADVAQRNHGPVIWLLSELLKISIEPVGNVVLCLHVLLAFLSSEENIQFVVDYHVTGVVLGSVASHALIREVQLYGCAILAELARYLPDQSRSTKAMIREAAVDIVLQSVHNFPDDLEIIRWSCVTMANVATTLNTIVQHPDRYGQDSVDLHGAALTYIGDRCTPVVVVLLEKFSTCDTVVNECQRFLDVFRKAEEEPVRNVDPVKHQVGDILVSEEDNSLQNVSSTANEITDGTVESDVNDLGSDFSRSSGTNHTALSDTPVAESDTELVVSHDNLTVDPVDGHVRADCNDVAVNGCSSLTNADTTSPGHFIENDISDDIADNNNTSMVVDEFALDVEKHDEHACDAAVESAITSSEPVEKVGSSSCDNLDSEVDCELNDNQDVGELNNSSTADPVHISDNELSAKLDREEEVQPAEDDFVVQFDSQLSRIETDKAGAGSESESTPDQCHDVGRSDSHTGTIADELKLGEESKRPQNLSWVGRSMASIDSAIEERCDRLEGSGIKVTVTKVPVELVDDRSGDGDVTGEVVSGEANSDLPELLNKSDDDKTSDRSSSSQKDNSLSFAQPEPSNSQSSSPSLNLDCERLQLRRSTYCVPKPKSDNVPKVNGSTPSISEVQSPASDLSEQELRPCQGFGASRLTADREHESHDLEILSDIENDSLEKSLETPDDVSDIPSYNECNSVDEDSYSLSDCCSEDHHSPRQYSMPSRSISWPGLESYYRSFDDECRSDENLSEEDDEVDEDLVDGRFTSRSGGERRAWGSIHPPDVEGLLANRTPSMVADAAEDMRKIRLMHLPPSHSDPNICLSVERKCWDTMPLRELLYLEEKSLESRSVSEVSSGCSQSSEPDEDGILDYLMSQAHGYMVKLLVCRTQMMLYVLSYWNRKRYLTVFDILGRPVFRVLEDVRLPAEIADFARSRQSETVHTAFVDILNQLSKVSYCMKSKMVQKLLLASEKLLVQPIPTSLSVRVCDSAEIIFVRWKQPDRKSIQSMLATVSKLQAKDDTEEEIRVKLNHLLAVVEQYCEK